VARYARGGAALSAEQKLYGSWNTSTALSAGTSTALSAGTSTALSAGSEALRLTWTGANWSSDGDPSRGSGQALFIYLDTAPGGATQAYNPYPAPADISLPDGMGADYLVWVRDSATAQLLHWNGSAWDLVPRWMQRSTASTARTSTALSAGLH
jgi:hypothetical protein